MAVTTDVINGNILGVYLGGVLISCTTSDSFNLTNETIETTCKDNGGAKSYTNGSQDWSMTVSGNSKYDVATNLKALQGPAKLATTLTVKFGSSNADDPYWQGQAFISNLDIQGDLNAPSTWSITLSPRGPIYLFNT